LVEVDMAVDVAAIVVDVGALGTITGGGGREGGGGAGAWRSGIGGGRLFGGAEVMLAVEEEVSENENVELARLPVS
jgi:hypothetical protein